MNADRICRICGKKESEHPIWMRRGNWTHDAEWLPEYKSVTELAADNPNLGEYLAQLERSSEFLREFVRKHSLAVEDLTEKQLAEAIRQAIACGDFNRHVCASNSSQAVIYIPHAREAYLTGRIQELKEQLKSRTLECGHSCAYCSET